jgi:ATP-dependent protease ClpP protease subunit
MDEESSNIHASGHRVWFYSDVNSQAASTFIQKTEEVLQAHQNVEVYINSSGGCLYTSLALLDYLLSLRERHVQVTTIGSGYVASAATIFFLGGQKRVIQPHCHVLVHQLRSYTEEIKFHDLKEEVNNQTKLMQCISSVYLAHTRMNKKTIQELLNTEQVLDQSDCVVYGFIHEDGAPRHKKMKRSFK